MTEREVSAFKDCNFPVKKWANSFMKRHKDIRSERVSKNITYARASTDAEVTDTFFGHLEKELDGIPDENIWNYDKTNVQDDPGSQKLITTRGVRYQKKKIQKRIKSLPFDYCLWKCCGRVGSALHQLQSRKALVDMDRTWTRGDPV